MAAGGWRAPQKADDLREELRQLEAKCSEAQEARATAVADLSAAAEASAEAVEQDRERQRDRAEESAARIAAAEEEVRVHAAARAEAEERAAEAVAAATDALKGREGEGGVGAEEEEGGVAEGSVAAAEAAAEEAQSELSRLKKAFREERKEHEAMLLESRCVYRLSALQREGHDHLCLFFVCSLNFSLTFSRTFSPRGNQERPGLGWFRSVSRRAPLVAVFVVLKQLCCL